MKSVMRNTTGMNTPKRVARKAAVPFEFPARRMEQSAAVTAAVTAAASTDILGMQCIRRGRIMPEENAALLLRRAMGAAGVKALVASTNARHRTMAATALIALHFLSRTELSDRELLREDFET